MRHPSSATTFRRPWLRGGLIALGWSVFTFWPLLSVLLAGAVASAGNCALDEGSVHPCLIAGLDVGSALSTLFVLGWFALVTVPLGLLLSVGVAALAAARFFRRGRR